MSILWVNTILADLFGIAMISVIFYFVFKSILKSSLEEILKSAMLEALKEHDNNK